MANPTWRTTEVLAFTERDGPGRPPSGPTRAAVGLVTGVLACTFAGLLASDTLCPDHRLWVQTLASVALIGVTTSLIGLWRGWASAPVLTVVSGLVGVAIGVLDAVHDPARGWLVVAGFAVVTVLAAVLGLHAHRIARTGPAPLAASPQADAPTAARTADADAAPEPRTRVRS